MKTHILFITVTALFFFQACDQKLAAPTGAWAITSKPAWVTSSGLDHGSDIWQFLPDGTCILGTTTGSYQALPNNQIRVQLPTQAATPGFTAVFSFVVFRNSLILHNLAEAQPVKLTKRQ